MACILDVAKYILKKKNKTGIWKLQKLCYYSQAWNLVWSEKELFKEDFQAWSNGPVSAILFLETNGKFIIESLEKGNIENLTEEEKENIDIVLADYGDKEPFWLREQTQKEDPWIKARQGLPVGVNSKNIITKDSIKSYYKSL